MQKDKSNYNQRTIPIILTLLALVVVAAGLTTYLWRQAVNDASRQRQAAETAEAKVALLEAANTPDISTTPTSPGSSDDGTVSNSPASDPIATALAYAHAQKGSENAKLTASIVKQSGAFVHIGMMTEGAGGYACVLKQSESIWLVIFCGQSAPFPEVLEPWSIPSPILDGLQ